MFSFFSIKKKKEKKVKTVKKIKNPSITSTIKCKRCTSPIFDDGSCMCYYFICSVKECCYKSLPYNHVCSEHLTKLKHKEYKALLENL